MNWIIIIVTLVVCVVGLYLYIKDRKNELEDTQYLRELDLLDNKINQLKLELISPKYVGIKHIEEKRRFIDLHHCLLFLQKEKSSLISRHSKTDDILNTSYLIK